MSGKDERRSLQCPLCDRDTRPTRFWSGYMGVGTFKNWCHLNLDERMRVKDLWRKYLRTRASLQGIDSVQCRPKLVGKGLLKRHHFLSDTLMFKRVKAKILFHDALMRQETGP